MFCSNYMLSLCCENYLIILDRELIMFKKIYYNKIKYIHIS